MKHCVGYSDNGIDVNCPIRKLCKRFTSPIYSTDIFMQPPYNEEYKYCKYFLWNKKKETK